MFGILIICTGALFNPFAFRSKKIDFAAAAHISYTMADILNNIMTYLVDSDSFERMQAIECSGVNSFVSYDDFVMWNKQCLNELPFDDHVWMLGFCKRLKDCKIGMMDLEDCGIWTADAFFYDNDKKLCIVHPR